MVGIIHRTCGNSTYYFLVSFLFELPLVAAGPANGYGVETGLFWPGTPLVVIGPMSGNLTVFVFRLR